MEKEFVMKKIKVLRSLFSLFLIVVLFTVFGCKIEGPKPYSHIRYNQEDRQILANRFYEGISMFTDLKEKSIKKSNYIYSKGNPSALFIKNDVRIKFLIKKGEETIEKGRSILNSKSPDFQKLSEVTSYMIAIMAQNSFDKIDELYRKAKELKTDIMMFSFNGFLPDLDAPNDYVASLPKLIKKIGAVTSNFSGPISTSMILNQDKTQKCVGYSGSIVLNSWQKMWKLNFLAEPHELYIESKKYSSDKSILTGSQISYLMKVFKKKGFIQRYHNINVEDSNFVETLKASVVSCQVVFLSLKNMKYHLNGEIGFEKDDYKHVVVVDSFRGDKFIVANSYGIDREMNGFNEISVEVLKKGAMDAWACIPSILKN